MSYDLKQFWRDNPQYDGKYKEQAYYPINYLPLAASAVQQYADFTVGMDADFAITNVYGSQTTAVTNAAYITTPLVVNLVYVTKTRNITSLKVEWTSLVGTTSNPRVYWAYPIVVPKGCVMAAYVDNPQAVAANVFLNFHGIKIFDYPAAGRG